MNLSKRLTIIVSAAVAQQANIEAKRIDTDGGERTFTVQLSASGNLPATHYWCGWQMTDDIDVKLRRLLRDLITSGEARVFDGLTRSPEQVLTTAGLKVIIT